MGMPRLKCLCRRSEVICNFEPEGAWSISEMKAVVRGVVRNERERRSMNLST